MKKSGKKITKKQMDILDAAVQAFQELGFDKASMDYIAKVANASKRTVYNHFPSKEALFRAVMDRFLTETYELKKIIYDSGRSLESQLSEFADAKLAVANNPSWLGLMKVSIGVFISHPDLAANVAAQSDDMEDTLSAWLKAAEKDGRLSVENPELAAGVFWAMVGGAFFWPAIFMGSMTAGEAKVMKKEIVETFLARYQK